MGFLVGIVVGTIFTCAVVTLWRHFEDDLDGY